MLAEEAHAILIRLSRLVKRAVSNSVRVLWDLLVCEVRTLKEEYRWSGKVIELNDILPLDKCQGKPIMLIFKPG